MREKRKSEKDVEKIGCTMNRREKDYLFLSVSQQMFQTFFLSRYGIIG